MRRFRLIAAGAILVSLGMAPSAEAQEAKHVVTEDQLNRMIESRAADTENDREAVRRFLDREDVRDAAGTVGVDVEKMKDGVSTLDDAEAAGLADRVEETEAALAQNTVVISTTAIIIGLLVLILILVAD